MGIITTDSAKPRSDQTDKPGAIEQHPKDDLTDKERGTSMPKPDGAEKPVPLDPNTPEAVPPISEPKSTQRQARQPDETEAIFSNASVADDEKAIEAASRAAHEATRAYSLALGEAYPLGSWRDILETDRDSVRTGVRGVIEGHGPQDSHEAWLTQRTSEGWRQGDTLDRAGKVHTNLLPYEQLTPEQKNKDVIFVGVARVVLDALGISRAGR